MNFPSDSFPSETSVKEIHIFQTKFILKIKLSYTFKYSFALNAISTALCLKLLNKRLSKKDAFLCGFDATDRKPHLPLHVKFNKDCIFKKKKKKKKKKYVMCRHLFRTTMN